MIRHLIALLTATCLPTVCSAASPPSHSDEINAFATITAMAQTASDRCADLLVNNEMLAKAPIFFHVTPDNQQAYRLAVDIEMKRLAATIAAATSEKAWCDEVYRAYGPEGDIVKGLLGR